MTKWNEIMVTKAFLSVQSLLNRVRSNDSGATAIEYGLIAALIALALVGGAMALGGGLNEIFQDVGDFVGGQADALPE